MGTLSTAGSEGIIFTELALWHLANVVISLPDELAEVCVNGRILDGFFCHQMIWPLFLAELIERQT